jgi:predicted ATPase
MAHLTLALLGPLQIVLDGRSISGFAYSKARALLVYLAVESDRPHPREALVTLLWPDLPEQAARTNLRQALASLREAIGDTTAATPFLLITRDALQFNPASDHTLDIHGFEGLLAACRTHRHRRLERCRSCLARLAQAAALYRGDFLAEFSLAGSVAFEEWEVLQREQLHQRALEALSLLAAYHERLGADEPARQYAQRQIELDPWREEAHRQLMRLLARAGQRSAALAQFEACRRVLADALGVQPTAETQALYEQIRAGTAMPPVPEAARSRVPLPPTSLVGRQEEQRALTELLEDPTHQLVTLLGPGGIGKTCLAQVVANDLAGSFAGGAVMVELAGLTAADQLAAAILLALEVPLQGAAEPQARLAAALGERELLVVLDSFEQLLDAHGASVRLLAALLRASPGVTWLVTSQVRLGLQAEWVFDLTGLALPPRGGATGLAVEALASFGAVRLFVERARQAQRTFLLDESAAQPIVRICELVEGLPLAIELAAAQVRAHPPAAIAAELDSNVHAYTTTLHDVPERHRSLWAALDYAWQLLTPPEQDTLCRLAIFRGGLDLAAAGPVAGASADTVQALIEKSLVRNSSAGATGAAGGAAARFDLHEMTRQYALRKLEAAPAYATTQSEHAAHFLALAETAAPQLTGAEQVAWINRLESEHANLRAALAWALEVGAADIAGHLGGALWRFWWLHSHLVEGRTWLERIGGLGPALSPAVRANVYNGAGVLANDLGDYAAAQAWHEQALGLRRELNDRLGMARSLGNLGNTARQLGQRAQSRAYFADCLAIFRELGHPWGIATTLLNLGVMSDDAALAEQEALYAESMALYRQLGDQHGMSIAIGNLGEVALRRRDFAQARRLYAEYVELSQTLGDTPSVAHSLMMLGIVAIEDDKLLRGVQSFGAAARLRESTGVPILSAYLAEYERYVAAAREALGAAAYESAWAEGAAMPLEQALRLAD